MLRYRRINNQPYGYVLRDEAIQASTRTNTCMQLFVTDKEYVYAISMKIVIGCTASPKAFAKAIGAPDMIICDGYGEQTSTEVKRYLQQIGTALRTLPNDTSWSTRWHEHSSEYDTHEDANKEFEAMPRSTTL